MAKKPLEIRKAFAGDSLAANIAHTWFTFNSQRQPKIEAWKELRNYVFATDTTTTTNQKLPWKNKTTLPKLCQIRDNLHSNYISALFPNDRWLKWDAYSKQDAMKDKALAIETYMGNKTRESHFRTTVSKLVCDYIDYGNAFATVDYEASYIVDSKGQKVPDYVGPKLVRISPLDIVFNPIANSFKESFKIVRSLKNIGELELLVKEYPDRALEIQNILENRKKMKDYIGRYGVDNNDKDQGFLVDGFGNYSEYLQSNYVEFLEFYGDIADENGIVLAGHKIIVVDRMWVVHKEPFKEWFGHAPIYHVGWRSRPDNLWAMGPLENLVGMQYRIDHLENLKADAMDLAVLPPLVIKGEVEEFEYAPNAEIHIDENGEVTELARNVQWVLQTDNAIALLEQRMEQYAGAPKEAMGIRTPGEKTMYEVQSLENAASRIFQEKASLFEVELLERVLNAMLETAKRNMDKPDVVKVMDDDLGVTKFLNVTKDDITASGKLRPIGARHFAAQAQLMQNLSGLANSPIWQQISPHLSTKNLAVLVEEIMGLSRYELFKPNVAMFEQQETARIANQVQEDLLVEEQTPVQ